MSQQLASGRIFDGYRLMRFLGRGGFGEAVSFNRLRSLYAEPGLERVLRCQSDRTPLGKLRFGENLTPVVLTARDVGDPADNTAHPRATFPSPHWESTASCRTSGSITWEFRHFPATRMRSGATKP